MNYRAILFRRTRYFVCLLILGLTGDTGVAHAATAPTSAELAAARRWVAAKFESPPQTSGLRPGLVVLANHDPVMRNTRGEGRPLTIADATYDRGLYWHAKSSVVVRLPGPGKTFTAVVGVDSNVQIVGGRGSVIFSVRVGDQQKFQSQVMREAVAGVPLTVDLDGATEFVLQVDDAGDGISCDQSDWADAKVVLNDGKTVWWRRACEYMLGDYYPLTSYSLEDTVWMAWQFDRPDLGEGLVQAFRRAKSPYESARFLLRGLEADAEYTLTDLDSGHTEQLAGHQLMQEGLLVTIRQRPRAPVILCRKVR